ncbi:hypothetical protein MMC29_007356, partial [Sticta canariensis]|nr:hypothetical protein [Sticta canariensis]
MLGQTAKVKPAAVDATDDTIRLERDVDLRSLPKTFQGKDLQMKKAEQCGTDDATSQPRRHHESRAVHISGSRPSAPSSDPPVKANFDSSHLTIGAGVAIFQLASSCVIICRHSVNNYWFLPKGRRDAGEDTASGAEREGFEEVDNLLNLETHSGFRNRLLPIPIHHRQPFPHHPSSPVASPFVCEPVWTQLLPQSRSGQYILFWYIAETVPPEIEASMNALPTSTPSSSVPYQAPPRYPDHLTITQRIALEPEGYQPVRHENTAANAEEALYESHLLPIETAVKKLEGT